MEVTDKYTWDVFISYSHRDEEWVVGTLLPRLEAAGFRICIDFRDFKVGRAAFLNMQDAVANSRQTLVVMTPAWVESQWTLMEGLLSRTGDPGAAERRTLPLLLKPCEIPPFISMLTHVNFTRADRAQVGWAQLLSALGVGAQPLAALESTEDTSRRREQLSEMPDVGVLLGRHDELAMLQQYIQVDRCRVVGVVGIGGIGKSALVASILPLVWADFRCVIWRSLVNAPPVDELLADCIHFLSDQSTVELPERLDKRITLLISYLRQERCLLVLDNFEAMLVGGQRSGGYVSGYEGYGRLLLRVCDTAHQSCILMTSREQPRELARFEGPGSPARLMTLEGLAHTDVKALLADSSLSGTEDAWRTLTQRYGGNPLALKLIRDPLETLYGGDIRRFVEKGPVTFGGVQELLDDQFVRLSSLERDIVYWLAINREDTPLEVLTDDLVPGVLRRDAFNAIDSLRRRAMVESEAGGFSLQPMILEYATETLIDQVCKEITTESPGLFMTHAFVKAQAKEHIRESQARVILLPLVNRLAEMLKSAKVVETIILKLVSSIRGLERPMPGYAGGNALSLLLRLKDSLSGCDFSKMSIWQAHLQGVQLQDVNFAYCDVRKSTFSETFGAILAVAFSPEGERLAAVGTDGKIRVWSVYDREPVVVLEGHPDWVWTVAWSADGRLLATGGSDLTVRLWDARTGECLSVLRGHGDRLRCVRLSADGRLVASGSVDRMVRLWEVQTGRCLRTLGGHTGPVWGVVFGGGEGRVASCSEDQTIRIWDTKTGECLRTLNAGRRVWSMEFSPDGATMATASEEQVGLWDASTGQFRGSLEGHARHVRSLAFSPDGRLLVSGSEDQTVRVWDLERAQCVATLRGHSSFVWTVAFSADGETIASGSDDKTVRLWNNKRGEALRTFQGYANHVFAVAVDRASTVLASGSEDHAVRLWDLNTGQLRRVLPGHRSRVCSLAFSPDGHTLASASDDRNVMLWDVTGERPPGVLKGHTHQVRSVAFSPHGGLVATASDDQTVRLWDPESGQVLDQLLGHTHRVRAVAFSPDGRLVASGSDDRTIRLWDVTSGQLITALSGHDGYVRALVFSFEGHILVSGSDDNSVGLWDTGTWQLLDRLRGHTSRIRTVTVSPTGLVASGGDDQTVRLWDLAGRRMVGLLSVGGLVCCVAFAGNGDVMMSGSEDERIRIWDVRSQLCKMVLRSERPYEGMRIGGATGISEAQRATLMALGAIDAI